MMIVWPDQWYHTSGDRIDKADPTQMKRVAVIGAAAAYTVASADDDMAIRLAGEIASNGTRRLGHQFIIAQELLNGATAENFADQYQLARAHVLGTAMAEKETLESVLQLATDQGRIGDTWRRCKRPSTPSARPICRPWKPTWRLRQLGWAPCRSSYGKPTSSDGPAGSFPARPLW